MDRVHLLQLVGHVTTHIQVQSMYIVHLVYMHNTRGKLRFTSHLNIVFREEFSNKNVHFPSHPCFETCLPKIPLNVPQFLLKCKNGKDILFYRTKCIFQENFLIFIFTPKELIYIQYLCSCMFMFLSLFYFFFYYLFSYILNFLVSTISRRLPQAGSQRGAQGPRGHLRVGNPGFQGPRGGYIWGRGWYMSAWLGDNQSDLPDPLQLFYM